MSIGKNIRTARKAAGLTQKELAQKLGLSFQSVAQWENDLRNPKFETIQKIADALGVNWMALAHLDTPEQVEFAREGHKKEKIRNRALPAVVELLAAIYGQCDLTAVYEMFEGCHVHEKYYALDKQAGMERNALEPLDMERLTDILVATTMAAVDGLKKDELSVQEKIEDDVKSTIKAWSDSGEIDYRVLEDIESVYQKSKYKKAIAVEDIDHDPELKELCPQDSAQSAPENAAKKEPE